MDNLALIIVGSVSLLFVVMVILFVLTQKKQDKKEAEQNREILEKLTIDIKSSTEDFEDPDNAKEHVPATDQNDSAVSEHSDSMNVVAESEKKSESEDKVSDEKELDVELEDEPADTTKPEPVVSVDIDSENEIVFEEEDKTRSVDSQHAEDNINKHQDNKTPTRKSKQKKDNQVSIDDDIFEMVDAAEVSVSDKNADDVEDAYDLDLYFEETLKADPPKSKQGPPSDTDSKNDIDELEALFQASHKIEDKVLAKDKKSPTDKLEPPAKKESEKPAESKTVTVKSKPPEPLTKPPEPAEKAVSPLVTRGPYVPEEPRFDPENQKRHDKARRIARVIVNDIRNYNPENLAEGIRIGNIMKTLGKEVERGRLLYIKRVPHDIVKETNYYREALVKILADGQTELLGL